MPRHDYTLSVSQDLEAETQPYLNGTAAFHLHNRYAKVELFPFFPVPTYIEVKLNILTFRFTTISRHCAKNCPPALCCYCDLRAWNGVLALKHNVHVPYHWSTLQLSTAYHCGVAAHTLASSTVF